MLFLIATIHGIIISIFLKRILKDTKVNLASRDATNKKIPPLTGPKQILNPFILTRKTIKSEHNFWACIWALSAYCHIGHLHSSRLNHIPKNRQSICTAWRNLTIAGSCITPHCLSAMTTAVLSGIKYDVHSGAKSRLGSWNQKQDCKMRHLMDLASSLVSPKYFVWPCLLYRYLI